MTGEVGDLLTTLCIVKRNDAGVSCGGEVAIRWAEFHRADGLDQTRERVCEAAGGVVEDVDAAVLVARCGHLTVGRDVDAHAKGTFRFVFGELLWRRVVGGDRGGGVDIDATVGSCACEVLSVRTECWCPMLACLFDVHLHAAFLYPLALFTALPELDIAAGEAYAGSYGPIERGADVMATQVVGFVEGFDKRVWVFVFGAVGMDGLATCAVDFDAG